MMRIPTIWWLSPKGTRSAVLMERHLPVDDIHFNTEFYLFITSPVINIMQSELSQLVIVNLLFERKFDIDNIVIIYKYLLYNSHATQ